MKNSREAATVNSALWAAYGDILGFPTELVDEIGVKRRIGESTVEQPRPWKRLVGGRSGAWINLEAGSYSDDTQLRLATSRSIRADGYFDVEAFAKIELPVWLSYSLGAGRGSKVGAASLAQRSVNWFSNFFDQRDVVYTEGGGNGAAMRIQPHVWAAEDLSKPDGYLEQVVQNAICTHGHPRGIAGAAIHAASLAYVLNTGELPPPSHWSEFGSFVSLATSCIEKNPDLSTFWLPTWNARTAKVFAEEMELARIEWETDIAICLPMLLETPSLAYRNIVQKLGGLSPHQRGSGLKCAVFALVATWLYKDIGANAAIIDIANFLSSDTDTIATMAGALLGALPQSETPPGPIQDEEYIRKEATRLFAVSQKKSVESFPYPDLMTWQPPRNQLDVVGINDNAINVAGLGQVRDTGEKYFANNSEASWQWLYLNFGQSVLCKQRNPLKPLSANSLPVDLEAIQDVKSKVIPKPKLGIKNQMKRVADLFDEANVSLKLDHNMDSFKYANKEIGQPAPPLRNIDDLTDEIIRSGFDPQKIGITIMTMAEQPDGIEKAIAFAAVIVKARQARLRRSKD